MFIVTQAKMFAFYNVPKSSHRLFCPPVAVIRRRFECIVMEVLVDVTFILDLCLAVPANARFRDFDVDAALFLNVSFRLLPIVACVLCVA